jgi:hypothetical protein
MAYWNIVPFMLSIENIMNDLSIFLPDSSYAFLPLFQHSSIPLFLVGGIKLKSIKSLMIS